MINNFVNVAIVHAAVGYVPPGTDAWPKVTIYAPTNREDNTSLHPSVANANVGGALASEQTDLVSVDLWLKANAQYVNARHVRFIKIDVQGTALALSAVCCLLYALWLVVAQPLRLGDG
jgi:hypothetical protein